MQISRSHVSSVDWQQSNEILLKWGSIAATSAKVTFLYLKVIYVGSGSGYIINIEYR